MNKIFDVVKKYNIKNDFFLPYGFDKGKINFEAVNSLNHIEDGKLVLVTAINPTKAGEGKTTVSIGLADGLNAIGAKTMLALREPSMGPVFGIKGGATGGGLSSIEPELDINLHFTGDFHAITSAHNLLSALIDAHIFYGNELGFDKVLWTRTLDVNDRSLRKVQTDLREDSFVITAASEIMAVLALANDLDDLKLRLNKILIGLTIDNKPIFVSDLGVSGALMLILKDAFNPNVVLTKEGNPALVHLGPFANIAHGCNSIIATKLALKMADYVVTEAGFGADLGMEKFLDLKLPELKKDVSLVVLVTTLHSLKSHGGAENYFEPNLEALINGIPHLEKHIENIQNYNLDFVIAINKHTNDVNDEINYLLNWAKEKNFKIEVSDGFNSGSRGTKDLAELVVKTINNHKIREINRPYDLNDTPKDKIYKIATKIYGASDVKFTKKALEQLEIYNNLIKDLPVCIAKTPSSFSDDSKLLGRPKNFVITIKEIKPSLGSNFFVAITKGINIMPGLNKHSRAYDF
ncbi:Formate--tetrahydrofolate ligase 1 [Haploplasma axanthum]|uniref:Formate--tetrahydrofolate ligase n=2 Tax=Haploplasma axanthum TaxID=29552 RepID=A0A449BC43_HAPAX|nr:formate--tetrahydrofolate ligase [Haploplasma axanthum]VEU80021.1 Formate--tetrahydrofolate ligase 1 [Haploplasma axanthum]